MKPALAMLLLVSFVATAKPHADTLPPAVSRAEVVEAPWTASIGQRDAIKLHLNVAESRGGMLGMSLPIAECEGLTPGDIEGSGRPVTFVLRREAGTVSFTGRFANGTGQGRLRYDPDPAYWAKIRAMGVRDDMGRAHTNLLALPLLDVRTDYIAAMRHEGALADLSDYVGMRAVNARPDVVHELKPLIAGPLRASDIMSLAALGVTPDYVRSMRTAFDSLKASDLSSLKALDINPADIAHFKSIGIPVSPQQAAGLKALNVTPDYVQSLRSAGARIDTADEAQSFRALGISPAAVKRAVEHGHSNLTASDVMETSVHY